jgi:hypothetical protein
MTVNNVKVTYLRTLKDLRKLNFKMNFKYLFSFIFIIATIDQISSSINPQIQVINDTSILIIEENVPFINNETQYILQLFYGSHDFKQFNDIHLVKLELLNNLSRSIVSESNSNLLIYQNNFKQTMANPQALTNTSFVQNAINVLHYKWELNSIFLNQSLGLLNSFINEENIQFEATIGVLRKEFFTQYFGTNFTIFLI